jgi:trimeric autotransporter adhesin
LLLPTQVVNICAYAFTLLSMMNKNSADGRLTGRRAQIVVIPNSFLRLKVKDENFFGEITMFRVVATFTLLLLFLSTALAQEKPSTETSAPLITATASQGRVRYLCMGEVQQTRLQVFSADGIQLFDSGFRAGNLIDWHLLDQQGQRVKDGSYLFLVTARDFSGKATQKYGTAVVERGEVYLERTNQGGISQGQASSLEASREAEAMSAVDRIGAAGLNRAGATASNDTKPSATTQTSNPAVINTQPTGGQNLAGAGTQNKIARWTDNAGALGDANIFQDASGNIGIGTNTPGAALEVTGNQFVRPAGATPIYQILAGSDPARTVMLSTDSSAFGWQITPRNAAGETIVQVLGQSFINPPDRGEFGVYLGADQSSSFKIIQRGGPELMRVNRFGNVGIGTSTPGQRLEVAGNLKLSGNGNGIIFPDGSTMTTASSGSGSPSGNAIVTALNDPGTSGVIIENRLPITLARLSGANSWTGANVFAAGLSANNSNITNVGNPLNAGDATNKAYVDANFIKFVPGAEQLSVGDANGTATMINLRGGSTCCTGPGGHTPAFFKVFQNGSFLATGNLGIGTSPMEGKGYRTSWYTYKAAFRSGYADNEWDDANVGFFSWAGGSNSTASGLYSLSFGDTNSATSTSSIAFGSGNEVVGAAGFSAGAGNRVCDTYGVAFGNNARSGGPYINGKCDPTAFNRKGLAAVAIGYNVTADQDHSFALGKFASNNGFQGTFIWSDGSASASVDTFRNTANNEFAARATGGFRFRTNLGGTTGCNLPAGSGVFNCTSSRATKENFLSVRGEEVLKSLRFMPITSWNYIAEGKQVRHLGPMAEDFFQAFGLGTNNSSIGVQDLAGVSLAAVKALDERTLALQQKTAEVEQLRTRVSVLEERLANIEQTIKDSKSGRKATRRR